MKSIIYCDVTCSKCGCIARASGYYSPERIKMLKRETKDWLKNHEDYPMLCPDCRKELGI